jgi:hypothetical protein
MVIHQRAEHGRPAVAGSVVDPGPGADKHALLTTFSARNCSSVGAAAADGRGVRPLGLGREHRASGPYHVHKIWAWPSMIAGAFNMAWAAKRYRSMWMGVIVHGLEGFFIVLIVAVLAGWYP